MKINFLYSFIISFFLFFIILCNNGSGPSGDNLSDFSGTWGLIQRNDTIRTIYPGGSEYTSYGTYNFNIDSLRNIIIIEPNAITYYEHVHVDTNYYTKRYEPCELSNGKMLGDYFCGEEVDVNSHAKWESYIKKVDDKVIINRIDDYKFNDNSQMISKKGFKYKKYSGSIPPSHWPDSVVIIDSSL